jgi:cytochrome c biogenesis protein CcmG/thiol:disulfide interchange protein DsbE
MALSTRCAMFVVLACVASLLAVGNAVAGADDVGKIAPALVVKQLDGQEMDLAALRGKIVVLNFWATWCTPCRAEMPMLDAFYRKHRAEDVVILGLSADNLRDRKDVAKAMRGLAYPAALLQEAKTNGFGRPRALPISYVIDAQGIIRARLMPTRAGLTEQELAAAAGPLMATTKSAGAPQ